MQKKAVMHFVLKPAKKDLEITPLSIAANAEHFPVNIEIQIQHGYRMNVPITNGVGKYCAEN